MDGIIDTHVHLWDVSRRHYAWLDELPSINRTHLPADYDEARAATSVEQFVFVECAGAADAGSSRDEVMWVDSIAQSHGRISGIVAFAPVEDGEAVAAHVAWLGEHPRVRGVRRLLQHEEDTAYCLRPGFLEGVRLLPEAGLTFDICIFHYQMDAVVRMVEFCPNVFFVLDHLGKPGIRAGTMEPWREHIRTLAALPNVVCKLSGAITEADHDAWTNDEVRAYLEVAIDAFGEDRLLFGSDWPVVNLAGSFGRWFALLSETLDGFSGISREKVFRENARRVYRLDGANGLDCADRHAGAHGPDSHESG